MRKGMGMMILCMMMLFFLIACSKSEQINEGVANKNIEDLTTTAEVIEGDFIYRLVSEEAQYSEDDMVDVYAELEYIGELDEVTISHAASPFYFPMVEETRDYKIDYAMNEPLLYSTLIKGQPLRKAFTGGGGYGGDDPREYQNFMRAIMNQEFPIGSYIMDGFAQFQIVDVETSEPVENFELQARIEFIVK
ncbi:hypothetical protein [Alkalihalobacillus pseudalcaliphilus]|uniref:hypothetical protein n=1 Tax=Alkalihalobacillus pseudalcaliphilus TaxID=79884 RepID=UPI00064D93FA|nr:hypothetical protein [Alkalihalobacillus pseudalcaliphilus]KMK75753.1 hypothetical protein AB990_10785 [Alkalihalobacillus pseudalcaliphilus]